MRTDKGYSIDDSEAAKLRIIERYGSWDESQAARQQLANDRTREQENDAEARYWDDREAERYEEGW